MNWHALHFNEFSATIIVASYSSATQIALTITSNSSSSVYVESGFCLFLCFTDISLMCMIYVVVVKFFVGVA